MMAASVVMARSLRRLMGTGGYRIATRRWTTYRRHKVNRVSLPPDSTTAPLYTDGRQSAAALDIARGALRCLRALGFAGTSELTLATGRRADIIAVNAAGEIWIVEIKSSLEDFRVDQKWPEYREFCDRLLFAVAPDFPRDILPGDTGLIVADRFGGEVIRPAPYMTLSAARRKAVLIAIARSASLRMQTALDPESAQLDI
jgi:hypothetical protein